jgi:uncharacterized protein YegP (UPF0339 family)
MPGKFTIFQDKGKKIRFHLTAANGEIIAASEAYGSKEAALKGIKAIQKNAPTAKIVDATQEKPAAKTAGKKTTAKEV